MPAQLPEELGSITTAVSERCAASPVTGWERQSKMLILGRRKGTWGKPRCTVGLGQGPRQRDEWWLQGSSPMGGSGGEVMEMAERPARSQGAVQRPRDPAKLADVELASRWWMEEMAPDPGDSCPILLMDLLGGAHQWHGGYTGNPALDQSCSQLSGLSTNEFHLEGTICCTGTLLPDKNSVFLWFLNHHPFLWL